MNLKKSSLVFEKHKKNNASSVGLGAFLEQNYGNVDTEKWHPI